MCPFCLHITTSRECVWRADVLNMSHAEVGYGWALLTSPLLIMAKEHRSSVTRTSLNGCPGSDSGAGGGVR